MAKKTTSGNNKLTYLALGISIVALIVAIYGLFPSKKHFGPKPGFNQHQIERQANFKGRPDLRHNHRPNMRNNNRPNAHQNARPNFNHDAQRPMPKAQPAQPHQVTTSQQKVMLLKVK